MIELDDDLDLLHVTIALDDWTTSDEATVLRIGDLKRDARRVLTAIAPNYAARVEIQSVSNLRHKYGGRTLCPHVHAWAWGHSVMGSAQIGAADFNRRLRATFPGADAVNVARIRKASIDLLRVARYAGKAPNRDATLYRHPETGRVNAHQSQAADRYVSFLRQFQILSMLDIGRLMFAGGAGLEVRNTALTSAREAVGRRRGCRSRSDELAAIEAFWKHFAANYMDYRFRHPHIAF